MDSNYSLADVATVMGRDGGSMGGAWWLILLFLFLIGSNGFGFGGGAAAAYATQADINSAIQAQTSALNQQSILMSSQNNNYETARLIDSLGINIMSQNNTNLVNAIQGFNSLSGQITNQTNVLGSKLDALGFQLENCCCSIKTLIKDNQIADLTNQLNQAQNQAVNSAQSLYLLSQLGTYTPGSGTTPAAGA